MESAQYPVAEVTRTGSGENGVARSPARLAPDAQDAFGEIVNIAMGRAAAALAESLSVFVRMSPPTIRVVTGDSQWDVVLGSRWRNRDVTVARQGFFGDLKGEALALFDPDVAATMNDLLGIRSGAVGPEVPLELANLLIGTCVGGVAAQLAQQIGFYPPAIIFQNRELEAGLPGLRQRLGEIVLVAVDFNVDARHFLGRVVFAFAPEETSRLEALIETFLTEAFG
jgi:chemotaxis protein CheY-P-specific phosphatase CheC